MNKTINNKNDEFFLKKVKKSSSGFLKDLLNFLKEYSVIGLAIGIVIGQASKDLVDSIVAGVFMPFIEIIISREMFNNLAFFINGVKFDIGRILSSFLTFLIIMFLLYLLIKKIIKSDKLLPPK